MHVPLEAPPSLNPDALPFPAPPATRLRDSPGVCDLYYDSTAAPVGILPKRRSSGRCLESVNLFHDVGSNQLLNGSRLLARFYAVPELRVLSSRDVKLVKLGSKQQWFDRSRRGAYPTTSLGGTSVYCPSAVVEFAPPI
ncbi:hypothetical protein NDU88_011715 [Pleurodeles waltl]|uniref:Uncharacterized protein n=1 Tax=Pleurodeles waltl TaxID=8319 RepID=A0AAV7R3W7_PLEWA|nr:hypothetical protein NDU88_011715 [Pleurodeles waltl]